MKIRIEKEEMQKVLQSIQGIVDKKTTMPILSHLLLKVDKTASVVATDLDIAVRRPINVDVERKGSLCIPAKKLMEIAREVDDALLLESQENNWLMVSSGKSTFKLMGLPEEEYPSLPDVTKTEEFSIDAVILKDMIEKTIYAAGESDTRYTLNGLLMHLIPKKKVTQLNIVGTDGHRLSLIMREVKGKASEERKVILPRKAASELRRLLEEASGDVNICLNKNHVFFILDEIVFTSRLIEGNYPNYDQVIPQDNEKKVVIDKPAFLKALRRTSIMSRERTNAIRIDLEDNRMILSSINPDIGEAREEMACQYKGDNITIGCNARYMIEAIQATNGEIIRMELQEPLSPVLIVETEDTGYKCVVMPMRI
ncbi:MAG: DNA polymerase III subunit beta [Thermodesulfovibrionia bacterium]